MKTENISFEIRKHMRMLGVATSMQRSTESLSHNSQKDRHTDRQINQWHFKLKRGRTIYVHPWHDLKCRNPKDATRKTVINKNLMKQSDKDILQCQCWKSMALLYINDQSEKEMKKTVLFTIVSGRINYLVINWTKKGKTSTVKCQTLWRH